MNVDELKAINVDAVYTYLETVQIIEGFYKGYYGKVQSITNDVYTIKILIKEKTFLIECKTHQLRCSVCLKINKVK